MAAQTVRRGAGRGARTRPPGSLADRYYNRQARGAAQFVPPGRCPVLLTADRSAV